MDTKMDFNLADEEARDEILTARIRSKLGRLISDSHSMTVEVDRGRVILKGPLLTNAFNRLLPHIKSVRGVIKVEEPLGVHPQPNGISDPQGETSRPDESFEPVAGGNAFAAPLGAAAGLALTVYGDRKKGMVAKAIGALGFGLFIRAITALPTSRLLGMEVTHRAVDIHKKIHIAAPVDQVFAFWTHEENFPRFMKNVRKVKKLKGDRSRWVMVGPGGVAVEWEAVITKRIPNKTLAWTSIPGSIVNHAGRVEFNPDPQGGTDVDITLAYHPLAGLLGYLATFSFGSNPKGQIDDDLMEMKRLIEIGDSLDSAGGLRRGAP